MHLILLNVATDVNDVDALTIDVDVFYNLIDFEMMMMIHLFQVQFHFVPHPEVEEIIRVLFLNLL